MKKQSSLVSILVINFNNAKLITRAINSCLSQSYKKIETILCLKKHTSDDRDTFLTIETVSDDAFLL